MNYYQEKPKRILTQGNPQKRVKKGNQISIILANEAKTISVMPLEKLKVLPASLNT